MVLLYNYERRHEFCSLTCIHIGGILFQRDTSMVFGSLDLLDYWTAMSAIPHAPAYYAAVTLLSYTHHLILDMNHKSWDSQYAREGQLRALSFSL